MTISKKMSAAPPFRLVMLVLLSNHVKHDWTAGLAGEVAVERMTGIEPA